MQVVVDMKIVDLGVRDEPIVLFGGPYSNLHALDGLLNDIQAGGLSAQNMICTGDMVAYCADGAACVEKMRDLKIPTVAGNCEKQLAEGAEDCGCGFEAGTACDVLSVAWYGHARQTIDAELRSYLGTCPDRLVFRHHDRRYIVIHGGASDISAFLWPSSETALFEAECATLEEEIGSFDAVIAGHCGMAFQRDVGGKSWVNAGTIGLPPHDGRQQTRYAILDQGQVSFHQLDYDAAAAQTAMIAAGLTQGYHESLMSGYWPSEDILPKQYRRAC